MQNPGSNKTVNPPWPYPRWIAHRGAGKLAPENTLAALRLGARRGWRMAEVDAQISADGVVFLLHDATLERTTNGRGLAAAWRWADLSTLDAGRWHSGAYAGEPLPTLAATAAWCQASGTLLNIEIKPSPGLDEATGTEVALQTAHLWRGAAVPPLLSSFSPIALAAARQAAPALPRALLLDRWPPDALEQALTLDCAAIVAHVPLWTADTARATHSAGLRRMAYTVNTPAAAQQLQALGVEGLISDGVGTFDPTPTGQTP